MNLQQFTTHNQAVTAVEELGKLISILKAQETGDDFLIETPEPQPKKRKLYVRIYDTHVLNDANPNKTIKSDRQSLMLSYFTANIENLKFYDIYSLNKDHSIGCVEQALIINALATEINLRMPELLAGAQERLIQECEKAKKDALQKSQDIMVDIASGRKVTA